VPQTVEVLLELFCYAYLFALAIAIVRFMGTGWRSVRAGCEVITHCKSDPN